MALAGVVIAGAIAAAYANSITAPFVFDDPIAIVQNPSIRHLSRLREVLSPPSYAAGAAGRPLVNLTLALNYAWGGLHVQGYHAVNLILHVLAAWTLFGLLRLTFRRVLELSPAANLLLAATATLVWAVHPLLTESVTCVIQRDEVLGALFYVLTLYAFARAVAGVAGPGGPSGPHPAGCAPSSAWLWISVLACAVGMTAKETVATAPLIVLLYDRTLVAGTFRRAWRARRAYYVGLAATWILLGALMATSQHRDRTVGFGLGTSPWQYLLTQCRALGIYLKLAFWPHPLVLDYGTSLVERPLVVALPGLAVLALIAATLYGLRRASPLALLGAAFFCILAPSSSFIPLVTQPIAEHRMYLPLAAIVIAIVAGSHRLLGRIVLPCWLAAAAALAVVTHARNADYHSELTLMRQSIAANSDNDRALLNLGVRLFEDGQIEAAIEAYRKALAVNPRAGDTHFDLGVALERADRRQEALSEYEAAVRLQPRFPAAQLYLGLAWVRSGRIPEALPHLEAAVRLQPGSQTARRALASARVALGDAAAEAGDMSGAIAQYQLAASLLPRDASILNNLGNAFAQQGRHAEAIAEYQKAIAARPGYASAHFNLAEEYAATGRFEDAKREFLETLRLDPKDQGAREALARVNALLAPYIPNL